jgi:hypothetical protein
MIYILKFVFNILIALELNIFNIFVKKDKYRDIFGVYLFIGLYGEGKTLSMVRMLKEKIKKYGRKNLIIVSDVDLKFTDYIPLKHWKQLVADYDKPVIFMCDELQNLFSAREFKDFPPQVLHMLTQNRKMRKMLICSTQVFDLVDVNFRRLSFYLIDCMKMFGFMFVNAYYKRKWLPDTDEYKNTLYFKDSYCAFYSDFKQYDTDQKFDSEYLEKFKTNDIQQIRKLLGIVT